MRGPDTDDALPKNAGYGETLMLPLSLAWMVHSCVRNQGRTGLGELKIVYTFRFAIQGMPWVVGPACIGPPVILQGRDRKSTRLNSSHG